MSTPESGAHWWVADKHGIVTDPVGFHSTGSGPPHEGHEDDERHAMLAASGQLLPDSQQPPAPGTGTVWIMPIGRTIPASEWSAIWTHNDEGSDEIRSKDGPAGMTREQAIAWALEQPAAARVIYDEAAEDYREL